MAINFEPIEEFTAGDFLGEFPASQVEPLVTAFNVLVSRYNNLLENSYVAGTGKYLKEKLDEV